MDRYLCLLCNRPVAIVKGNRFRSHKNDAKEVCDAAGTMVSATQLAVGPIRDGEDPMTPAEGRDYGHCETCRRRCPLRPDGLLVDHRALGDEGQCPSNIPSPIAQSSGDTTSSSGNQNSAAAQTAATSTPYTISTASGRYSQPCQIPTTIAANTTSYAQPGSTKRTTDGLIPMSPFAEQLAASVKQLFYHWNTRKSSDNRNAQIHLGPSEIGTPCDRRLVLTLLGAPAVNPGGDGWAAWMGTQGHAGLAEMFVWADAGSGRYSVETPLVFPSALVPRGTADLLDRVLCIVIDHKFMGQWALKKLRTKGPSETYRVQVHTYAYGARLRGEKVDRVAIIAWPREGSSLDDLYIWEEPYDPMVAAAALKRVDDLKAWADKMMADGSTGPEVAAAAAIVPDCTYCPFHLKASKHIGTGCNGK